MICVFVFAYAKSRFSHDAIHIFSACGYCGSDGLVVMVLQTYIEAKRVYATIVDCKVQVNTPIARGKLEFGKTKFALETVMVHE